MVAFGNQVIRERNFRDISDLQDAVVSLRFSPSSPISGSSNASEVYLRGVGQSDFLLTTEPGVGIYLDGVYVSRSIGSVLSLLDIERTEVLRGPEGTLYGKNTIGGAINVISTQPEPELAAAAGLTLGNDGQRRVSGMLNLPILNKQLLTRLNIAKDERDGYLERIQTGQELGRRNSSAARLLVSLPADLGVSASLSIDGSRSRNESVALGALWSGPPEDYGRGALTDLYNQFVAAQTGVPFDNRWLTDDPLATYGTGPFRSNADIWGIALTASIPAGQAQLKSISGYREIDASFGRDPDSSPLTIVHTANDYSHRQFSQELQLTGDYDAARLQWIAGIFALYEKGADDIQVDLVEGVSEAIATPLSVSGKTTVENYTAAAYGQASFALNETFTAGLGLRYSYEKKRANVGLRLLETGQRLIANPARTSNYDSWSPRVSLDYTFSDDGIAFASVSRGVKSGGYTGRYSQPAEQLLPFNPETLLAYEIGVKMAFPETRIRINASAFYSDYQDIQVLIFDGVTPQTRNAADGSIRGLEIESFFAATDQLSAELAFGYMDANYEMLEPSLNGITVPIEKSSAFVKTPEFSVNASLRYSVPLASSYTVSARLDYAFTSEIAHDAINTEELIQDDLHIFNARLALAGPRDRWEVSLYAKNLGNQTYIVGGAADKATFGTVAAVYAPPREWGISLSLNF